MPIVRRNAFMVELAPNEEQEWIREIIRLRVASKDLDCNEHDKSLFKKRGRVTQDEIWIEGIELPIIKGDLYVRDAFWYENSWNGRVRKVVNFVCLKCWKGPIPKRVSGNWKKEEKEKYYDRGDNKCFSHSPEG